MRGQTGICVELEEQLVSGYILDKALRFAERFDREYEGDCIYTYQREPPSTERIMFTSLVIYIRNLSSFRLILININPTMVLTIDCGGPPRHRLPSHSVWATPSQENCSIPGSGHVWV